MIKKTLYFGNACYLSKKENQLKLDYPDEEGPEKTVPIEDVGIIVIDHRQITITHSLMNALLSNNTAIITCDESHLPQGLMLPMYSHHAYVEKLNYQLESSLPLRKNLWQQTVMAKIRNQAMVLYNLGVDVEKMGYWMRSVRSGDPDNYEGRAAAYYWEHWFRSIEVETNRGRFEGPPNNLLNYGYAILRATIARSLVGSGMLPAVGIHHRNKYNPFCLADDVMEPYRPYVDMFVWQMVMENEEVDELTPELKRQLLTIPVMDVIIGGQDSPLMVAARRTSASLMNCFDKTERKLLFPKIQRDEK